MKEELLVENAASVELAQLDLEIDVAPEQLVFRTLADGRALNQTHNVIRHQCRHASLLTSHFSLSTHQDLARARQVLLSHFEVREHDPDLGEGEALVRHQIQTRLVHLARAIRVARLQLLKDGVVDPQVDVATPVPLLLNSQQLITFILCH